MRVSDGYDKLIEWITQKPGEVRGQAETQMRRLQRELVSTVTSRDESRVRTG